MSITPEQLLLLLSNKEALTLLLREAGCVAEPQSEPQSEQQSDDYKQRMAMLESKMAVPVPRPLAFSKGPPPKDDDASFPWPAQVQTFLRRLGVEQYPAEFCVDWWLESNQSIDVSECEGLPRGERYRLGLEGGEYYENEWGIVHWRPTSPPEPPKTWDNEVERVKPAVPSRERSDAEKDLLAKTWRSLVPKLKRFGLRHLGSRDFLGAWLSDVRFALLEAELLAPKPTSGFEVAELPPFATALLLCKLPVSGWSSNPWSTIFRRLARNWAEHGQQGAGTRRPTKTDRHQVQADDETLSQTAEPEQTGDATAPALHMFVKILKATGICDMPNTAAKVNLIRVVNAISKAPDAERKVQIEISGLSESTFYHHLSRVRSLAGNDLLFKG